ncbi:unnamed protein product [Agarophyton chilense]
MTSEVASDVNAPRRRNSFCFVSLFPVTSFPHISSSALLSSPAQVGHYPRRLQLRSLFLSSTSRRPHAAEVLPLSHNDSNFCKPRCALSEDNKNRTLIGERHSKPKPWTEELSNGSVLEVWYKGEIRFAFVSSISGKAIGVNFVEFTDTDKFSFFESKISFGEVISIWPKSITPSSPKDLASVIEMGLKFLRNSPPRSLDLTNMYSNMRRIPKGNPEALRDSFRIACSQFPLPSTATPRRHAAVTAATGVLIASDTTRFKRATPGSGWRALSPSVVESRGRNSFTDLCKVILENPSNKESRRPAAWSREQLDMLREIELIAAGGGNAKGKAATALESLGYQPTDDGATHLLLDLDFWSTGATAATDGTPRESKRVSNLNGLNQEISATSNGVNSDVKSPQPKRLGSREWSFPPSILKDARELRFISRKRRALLSTRQTVHETAQQRRVLQAVGQAPMRVYCIDDKNSRFLDDAFSVILHKHEKRVHFFLHITDVDEVVKPGSAIDKLARERGMSLYLPLRPLHMLPAAAMDAASFSSNLATEAITIEVDFDLETEALLSWKIYPSLVPPVKRIDYKQFDAVLTKNAQAADVSQDEFDDLHLLAKIAPGLAAKLNKRPLRRNRKYNGNELDEPTKFERDIIDSKSIASVRLVKSQDKSSSKSVRMAKVVDFQSNGAHGVVDNILSSAGALVRQFAKQNNVWLPEGRYAASYVARCGTAPLRRYADLTIQRQIKSILFGKQPAGKRQMEELRVWLARRHSAGEKTVADHRRNALFESLSAHCAQQSSVAGKKHSVLKGRVRNVTITKSSSLKIDVSLEGTGLSSIVKVSGKLLTDIFKLHQLKRIRNGADGDQQESGVDRNRAILAVAKSMLTTGSRVRVQILRIDTSAQTIEGTAFEVVSG